MKELDIAVIIQNLVQFYSIKNGIDALINKGYSIDIYVPVFNDNTGMDDMFNDTYNSLTNLGYSPVRTLNPLKKYKITLEPYPIGTYNFNSKYRIKYKYAPIGAKPSLTYTPGSNIYYDAILCSGNYEAEYLNVYSKTYVIGNLKYINYEKKYSFKDGKPILLYLPTYGSLSSIDDTIDTIKLLKEDYYVIAKFHHGTSFLKKENYRLDDLKSVCDEFYDHTTQLSELLKTAKVVLSDNSGSIFESIYAEIPVAIYSKDPNENKLGNFNTIQYMAIKNGFIPYTNVLSSIPTILKQALSNNYINKQVELKKLLFDDIKNPVQNFVTVIESYLSDNINENYKYMHDVLVKDYNDKTLLINKLTASLNTQYDIIAKNNIELGQLQVTANELKELQNKFDNLNTTLEAKNIELNYYKNGKLHKLANKIYKLYYKLTGRGE